LSEPYRRLVIEWYRDEDGTRVVRATVSGPLEGNRTMLRALPGDASPDEEMAKLDAIYLALAGRAEEVAREFKGTHDGSARLRQLKELAEIAEGGSFEELSTILTLVDVLAERLGRAKPSPQA
jgi:hypothetical protein